MPELPDITVYCEALAECVVGTTLERIDVTSPFLLRTFEPDASAFAGDVISEIRRLGKRIAIGVGEAPNRRWAVIHLMIAGRLKWSDTGQKPAGRSLALFHFTTGTLALTEAGTKKRASLHLVDDARLGEHQPGGLNVLTASDQEFADAIRSEGRTLKRILTAPQTFDGIGNAYSDEILHAARLSPITLTRKLTTEEIKRLHRAAKETLTSWTERLRTKAKGKWPAKVTAFHPEMAVHGKYGEPCPVCDTKVARILRSENELNYCPECQTGGRVLADRSLSRLFGDDWHPSS